MPFKSEAQRRLFHAMAARGEISEDKVREWEHATKNKKSLPYHKKKTAAEALVSLLPQVKRADLSSNLSTLIERVHPTQTPSAVKDLAGMLGSVGGAYVGSRGGAALGNKLLTVSSNRSIPANLPRSGAELGMLGGGILGGTGAISGVESAHKALVNKIRASKIRQALPKAALGAGAALTAAAIAKRFLSKKRDEE